MTDFNPGYTDQVVHNMRRVLALTALLALVSGPVGRVVCLWECAGEEADACSHEDGGNPSFAGDSEHCVALYAPLALIAKTTAIVADPSVAANAPDLVFALSPKQSAAPAVSPSANGPPPLSGLIPLRI